MARRFRPEVDYYAVLGLEWGDSPRDVMKKTVKLINEMKESGRDPASYKDRMNDVIEAFDVLRHPDLRPDYMLARRNWEVANDVTPRQVAALPAGSRSTTTDSGSTGRTDTATDAKAKRSSGASRESGTDYAVDLGTRLAESGRYDLRQFEKQGDFRREDFQNIRTTIAEDVRKDLVCTPTEATRLAEFAMFVAAAPHISDSRAVTTILSNYAQDLVPRLVKRTPVIAARWANQLGAVLARKDPQTLAGVTAPKDVSRPEVLNVLAREMDTPAALAANDSKTLTGEQQTAILIAAVAVGARLARNPSEPVGEFEQKSLNALPSDAEIAPRVVRAATQDGVAR